MNIDPIEGALREADDAANKAASEQVRRENLRNAWRWFMQDKRGRLIARHLIEAASHDEQFTSNFGAMAWKFSRSAFVREYLIQPMREASLRLFHEMEREKA